MVRRKDGRKKESEKFEFFFFFFLFPLKPPLRLTDRKYGTIRELFSTGRGGDVGEDSISW